jgi:RNA polymerase subunit RPABC4/transcription elongation factor Spt4
VSNVRSGSPGATRACPHCKETILESAAVCPQCKHHVRFAGGGTAAAAAPEAAEVITALKIEGSIRQPADTTAWEYSVVVSIRNESGKEIARKLIGVGAMVPDELRTFNLSVEVVPMKGKNGKTRH